MKFETIKNSLKTETSYPKRYLKVLEEQPVIKALKEKSKKSGISYSILKKVFDRGMEAWRGGHRPGVPQHAWAHARVNSFITGGKTRHTTDADLWKQVKKDK